MAGRPPDDLEDVLVRTTARRALVLLQDVREKGHGGHLTPDVCDEISLLALVLARYVLERGA